MLHALAARYLSERLLELSVPLARRIALVGDGLQRRQGVGLVLLPGGLPGFRARDAADGALGDAGVLAIALSRAWPRNSRTSEKNGALGAYLGNSLDVFGVPGHQARLRRRGLGAVAAGAG